MNKLILISNDDSIHSEGIKVLARYLLLRLIERGTLQTILSSFTGLCGLKNLTPIFTLLMERGQTVSILNSNFKFFFGYR
ncbi:MAG: hypothetical protein A3G39_08495 [Deltaproteobacteria bacterium RIFCSPLOWO2_12_FULL_43_16]|nr:MAG: hypothetical protein A3G39_08495 [Deltaproteobacteria bacterium RIFCSPLOWO2_12_FULL_43_16]